MNIRHYKLKEHTKIDDLLEEGFRYSVDRKYLTKLIPLEKEIVIWIKISLINFSFSIEVLDDDFCQYYIPFYGYQEGKIDGFDFLYQIINRYNDEMNKLKCFEIS